MNKIEKLTEKQAKRLVEFRKEWLDIGLCCEPANFNKAEEQITFFYEKLGKKRPMFFHFSSPIMCELGYVVLEHILKKENFSKIKLGDQLGGQLMGQLWDQLGGQLWDQLRGQLRDQLGGQLWDQLRDQLGGQLKKLNFYNNCFIGQHEAAWIAFYKFGLEIGAKYKYYDIKLLNAWGAISESAFWWSPYEGICIICDRPRSVSFDDQRRLHNENKMAVQFSDGWGVSAWHGIRIPDNWIKDKSSLTPKIALTWQNVEQRRAACEIIGWANVLEHPDLKSKVIDKDLPHIGTLIQVDLPDAPKQWFLKYQCGTGRWFAESVNDKTFDTALKANAGGNGWRPGLGEPEDFIAFIRT